ncbi:hypothetical protein PUNSTDRAFT_143152 [Punctularia strigosozonata HHB-11173 SS5]|uniref:uncharacterized protein n=1 Tax=Punctularia strigosozonata (strain HHB-11173) TaxID=741275 RepID=UPI0004416687|nr:uncharacterized protein PUNSTDRAFT_143152 [Punctularia strigosozonata HHB-11173 SS5]EIN09663.1 hypothetical protein PUNSTDRAFT_143152 [Punctularia strigosozonata HHB-11173 SS5]
MTTSPVITATSVQPAEPVFQTPCGICRRQFSKYLCSRCNLPYCSLGCFRSDSHAECSEAFYRKEIESDISGTPSKTADERRQMMELLKRFEEDSQQDDDLTLDLDDEDENSLAARLGHLDIESASPDALWDALDDDQRAKFMKLLGNPSSEMAQQLLASPALQDTWLAPWWEDPSYNGHMQNGAVDLHDARRGQRYGASPEMMSFPSKMVKSLSTAAHRGPFLLYNLVAVCLAYAYTSRHLCAFPLSSVEVSDIPITRSRIAGIAPFLTDRRSQFVHPTLSSVETAFYSHLSEGGDSVSSEQFCLLLRDAAALLRARRVVQLRSDGSDFAKDGPLIPVDHPTATTLLVISDLHRLFLDHSGNDGRQRQSHVTNKLVFYGAHVLTSPPALLRSIADEAMARSLSLAAESVASTGAPATEARRLSGHRRTGHDSDAPRIEEVA